MTGRRLTVKLQLTENCLVDLLVDWTLRFWRRWAHGGHAVSRKVVLRFDFILCFDRTLAACRQLCRSATAARNFRGSLPAAT